MQAVPDHIPEKWIKASVIGSIWAAIEIIAGSFLHNLKVPFAGTVLSMVSVALLILFARHWKTHGIIIRAAVVCALMKSISPSAVILGPMVAIFMEGLIIELIILVFRRNLVSYLLAGAVAVSWALFQKVLSLLIIYGFDLVRVAEAFYEFLVRKIGIESLSPRWLLVLVIGIYTSAGVFAAWTGYRSYRRAEDHPNLPDPSLSGSKRPVSLETTGPARYSILHILLIAAGMITTLVLINNAQLWLYATVGILFTIYGIARYHGALRHLQKPAIWLQFIVVALVAAIAWEGARTGKWFSPEGVVVGLKLVFRAVVIITGFAAISIELRNPLIRNLLFRNGMAPLYLSLNLAFSALPGIIATLPEIRSLRDQRRKLSAIVLRQSDMLFHRFMEEARPRGHIYLLTGDVQGGKTTLAKSIVARLKDRGVQVSGIITHGTFNERGRNSFTVEVLPAQNRFLLASTEPRNDWFRFRRFYFDPEVFGEVNQRLISQMEQAENGTFILDEIGPLELSGKGWHPLLEFARNQEQIRQLWVVREKLAREVMLYHRIPPQNLFHAGDADIDRIADCLRQR